MAVRYCCRRVHRNGWGDRTSLWNEVERVEKREGRAAIERGDDRLARRADPPSKEIADAVSMCGVEFVDQGIIVGHRLSRL